ncbi:MAG TPA: M48 family metalloprotease [Noviherbaspirillum sp.]
MLSLLVFNFPPALAQGLPSLGDSDRAELSPLMERRLGEQIMRDIRRDRDYLDDAPLLEYLNRFGTSLVEIHPEARGEANFDYFFFPVRDRTLNAFALPGGFIGVHTGLVLAAQNESELGSVLAHEIGHVSQRHIARMLGKQRQDSLIPLAAAVLAALAASASPDAASAVMMGGQGLAIQRQLNFSRDAEREADRIGVQILRDAGFDTSGMIGFFGRVQSVSRVYGDGAPAYLRSHPMTTERIADIQARTSGDRYRQRVDSLDFHLVRARARVLQNTSAQGLREAGSVFDTQLRQEGTPQAVAALYGHAFIALREGKAERARDWLGKAIAATKQENAILTSLGIDVALASRKPDVAVTMAERAKAEFPLSRGIARQYAEALLADGQTEKAIAYLRDQAQLYRQDARLQDLLARAYAAQGKQALQHLALAEAYALTGSLPAAIDQLGIARRAGDASFHELAVIDAREREFKARWMEQMKETQEAN